MENMSQKPNDKAFRNTSINLGYMEDTEPEYYCTEYVTSEDIIEVLEENFNCLIQAIKANRGQHGAGGEGISKKNRDDNSQWFLSN